MKEEIYDIIKWCLCFVYPSSTINLSEPSDEIKEMVLKYGGEIYHAENITNRLLELKYSNTETLKEDIKIILSDLHISYDTTIVDSISLIYLKYMRNDKLDNILNK
jgi:hypothetical protein